MWGTQRQSYGKYTDVNLAGEYWIPQLLETIFVPKESRRKSQQLEAIREIAEKKLYDLPPELQQQYVKSLQYLPGDDPIGRAMRRIFRGERAGEPLFEPSIKTKAPITGRREEYTPPGGLAVPFPRPPLVSEDEKREMWSLAKEIYPEDEDEQRDFVVGMMSRSRVTSEEKRERAIGKAQALIDTFKTQNPGATDQQAIASLPPRLRGYYTDYFTTKQYQRENIRSMISDREERQRLNRIREARISAHTKFEEELSIRKQKHKESHDKYVDEVKKVGNAQKADKIAQEAYKLYAANYKWEVERHNKIERDLSKDGLYSPSYRYDSPMKYFDWLQSEEGMPFYQHILVLSGQAESQPKESQPTPPVRQPMDFHQIPQDRRNNIQDMIKGKGAK